MFARAPSFTTNSNWPQSIGIGLPDIHNVNGEVSLTNGRTITSQSIVMSQEDIPLYSIFKHITIMTSILSTYGAGNSCVYNYVK